MTESSVTIGSLLSEGIRASIVILSLLLLVMVELLLLRLLSLRTVRVVGIHRRWTLSRRLHVRRRRE